MIHHGDMLEIMRSIVVGSISVQVSIARNALQKVFQHLRHVLLLVVIIVKNLVTFQTVVMTLGSIGLGIKRVRVAMIICIGRGVFVGRGGAEVLVSLH